MYTDTINSVSKLLSGTSKPVITISLDNPQSTYTTFSPLSGTVTIVCPAATAFSTIDITLEGSTCTFVEKMTTAASNYRATANHTFLKLIMPLQMSSYPSERTFVAGKPYNFSFNFAVPNQLLPQSCTHACSSRHVHFAHLSLPPTMGTNKCDLSPEMAKISYAIKAKISKYIESGKTQKLCEASLPVNIIPAVLEAPPMSIDPGDKDFKLSKTKSLKKGMFKGKLGHITLKAEQPRDFMLSAPQTSHSSQPLISSSNTTSSTSSAANFSPFSSSDSDNTSQASQTPSTALTHLNLTVNFTPDPSAPTAKPPRLLCLTSKLRTSTFYAARATTIFPLRSQLNESYDPNSGIYESTMPLPSRNLESIAWVKNEPATMGASTAPPLYEATAPATQRERRGSDSGYSTFSDREHEGSNKEKETTTTTCASYSTQISLPLSLPSEKSTTWLPSFHSCLVSRTYTLEISLSLANGTIVPTTSLSLKVPVQIGVLATGQRKGSGSGPPISLSAAASSSSGSTQIEDARTVLPPGYEVFVGSGSGMAQRRRGGNTHTSSLTGGVNVEVQDGTDGISLVTGGEWGATGLLTSHGR